MEVVLAEIDNRGTTAEIRIVNDGREYNSGQIVQELAAGNSRLRAFHRPQNRTIGMAFMTAVDKAQGE